eukprot:7749253-Lingulodinium_polyedra.AAC.1
MTSNGGRHWPPATTSSGCPRHSCLTRFGPAYAKLALARVLSDDYMPSGRPIRCEVRPTSLGGSMSRLGTW